MKPIGLREGRITASTWRDRRLAEIRDRFTEKVAELREKNHRQQGEAIAAHERLLACLASGRAEAFAVEVQNHAE